MCYVRTIHNGIILELERAPSSLAGVFIRHRRKTMRRWRKSLKSLRNHKNTWSRRAGRGTEPAFPRVSEVRVA